MERAEKCIIQFRVLKWENFVKIWIFPRQDEFYSQRVLIPSKMQHSEVRVREGLSNTKMKIEVEFRISSVTPESWSKYVMKFQINAHI